MAIEIADFDLGGAWLELKVESDNGERLIKFKLKPLSEKERHSLGKKMKDAAKDENSDEFSNSVMDIIVDWDILSGGEKPDCNEENKKQIIPYFLAMRVVKEKKEDDDLPDNIEKAVIKMKLSEIDVLIKNDKKDEAISLVKSLNDLLRFSTGGTNVGLSILTFAGKLNNFIKN